MARNTKTLEVLKRIDWLTVALVLGLALFGVIAIASATCTAYDPQAQSFLEYLGSLSSSLPLTQFLYLCIGIVCVIVILFLDYNNIREFCNIIYWLCIDLLILTLIFGSSQRGLQGWLRVGGVGIQTSEICKPLLILVLARDFAERTENKNGGIDKFRDLLPILLKFIVPVVLIGLQPDLGTAMVYVFILMGLLFMSKTSFKILGTIAGAALVLLPVAWLLMTPDQKGRIEVFLDPSKDPEGKGFNVLRAKTVASSGGFRGKGFFSQDLLTQQSSFLPEDHTDFIFSSTTEAIGFAGAILLVAAYLFLIFHLFRISMRARDDFGMYIIVGVACMLLFHVFENIGMNIGLMPVTGIPLPLISYGGSNLLTTLISIGMVLNVHMRSQRRVPL